MKQEHEDTFSGIISETLEKAADVPCPKEDYKEGLEYMLEEIHMALSAVNDELDS